jgi:hypothetical protein
MDYERQQNPISKMEGDKDGGGKTPDSSKDQDKDKKTIVSSVYQLSTPKNQAEIDALGSLLSKKQLSDVEGDLLNSGWEKVEIDGSMTIFNLKVPIGNGYDKKYMLYHNSKGKDHSINGQPVKYWKLYEDKKLVKRSYSGLQMI